VLGRDPDRLPSSAFLRLSVDAAAKRPQPDIKLPYIFIRRAVPPVSAPRMPSACWVKPLEVQLQTIKGVKAHERCRPAETWPLVTLEVRPQLLPRSRAAGPMCGPRSTWRAGRFPPDAEPPIIQEQGLSPTSRSSASSCRARPPSANSLRIARATSRSAWRARPGVPGGRLQRRAGGEQLEVTIDPAAEWRLPTSPPPETRPGDQPQTTSWCPRGTCGHGSGNFRRQGPKASCRTPTDILRLPIKRSGDKLVHSRGHRRGPSDLQGTGTSSPRFNGEAGGGPRRLQTETARNILATVDTVHKVVAEESKRWPPTVKGRLHL